MRVQIKQPWAIRALSAGFVLAALAACSDTPPAPTATEVGSSGSTRPNNAADAQELKVVWLAPLGTATADSATFDATFDETVAVVVEICAWTGTTCAGAAIARFSTAPSSAELPLTINRAVGEFEASWNLMSASFTTRRTYRVRVLNDSSEIGSVTIDVVRGRWALTRTDGSLAPLIATTSLPIRFFIAQPNTPIIPSTTKVLDAEAIAHIDASTLTSLSFTAGSDVVENLRVGDIVAAGVSAQAPNGLLRRITSKTTIGQRTLVQTVPASLAEAIQDGEVHFSQIAISPQPVAGEGGALWSRIRSATFVASSGDIPIGTNGHASTELSAEISVSGDLRIEDHQLHVLEIRANIIKTASLRFTASAASDFSTTQTIFTWPSLPRITVFIGLVPIVLVPELDVQLGATGSLEAGVTTGLSLSNDASYGFRYENGALSPIWVTHYTFTADPFQAILDANIKIFAGPRLTVNPYFTRAQLASLGLEVSASLELDAIIDGKVHFLTDPWYELFGGIEASAAAHLRLWGATFVNQPRLVLADFEVLIAKGDAEVIISPRYPETGVSGTADVSAVVRTKGGAVTLLFRPISWISRDPSIAEVFASLPTGTAAGGETATITGNQAGHVWIVASASGDLDSVDVTVAGRSISISPASSEIGVHESITLSSAVTGLATGTVDWRSLDPTYASVVGDNLTATVTGIAVGTARIVARIGTTEDTALVTVGRISVTPHSYGITVGQNVLLTASLTGVPPTEPITWNSLDASFAIVVGANATATVTGVAAGIARIVATAGTIKDTAIVTVTGGVAVRLSPSGNVPIGPDPYTIQVVNEGLATVAAPDSITVTLVRVVHTCLGDNVFPVQTLTVTVPAGQSSVAFGTFVPGRYPACFGVQIAAKYTITSAVQRASTMLDLTKVPAEQLWVNIIR